MNESIIRGRFYGKQLNTTIIQIYAPTNEADPEDKEEFDEKPSIKNHGKSTKARSTYCYNGHRKRQGWSRHVRREDVMGKEGLGDRNENGGYKFISFCA